MENKQGASNKWLTMIVVILGLFMVNLDTSIVNLAVSKMQQAFSSSLDQIQWVISAYTLTLGVTTPVTAYLSDRFGIKKVFIIALMLFTTGSFLCGISWNAGSIIAFRVIQGLGGAIIISLGMTILTTTFDKSEMGLAIGIMGIALMVAPAVGPTLGGYIIENLDWRLIFLINIPVGIAGSVLALILLKESEHKPSKHFDLVGFLTSSTGMACVLYVLGKDNIDWGDIKNVMLMIIGCYSLLMFVINELMVPEPMLDLRLLKNYTYCMSNIIMNIAVLVLYGGIFLMPVFLQQLKGLTPMQAGVVLFPEAIATAVAMVISGKLSNKLDTRIFAISALIFLGFNSYSMSKITLDTSTTSIMLLLLVRGLGVGFLMAPVQTIGLNAVPKEVMSNASALLNTVKQVGASIGITVITSVMQHRSTANYADLAQQVNSFNPNSMNLFKMLQGLLVQSGVPQTDAQSGALSQLYGIVAKQAQLLALNDTMRVICIITVVIVFPTLLLKESKRSASDAQPIMME